MAGDLCVGCGQELCAEDGVLVCSACGCSQVQWKNRHRTTEEYGRLDLKPWRSNSGSNSAAAKAKQQPNAQPKTNSIRPPWKPVGRRANSAMFVKEPASATIQQPPMLDKDVSTEPQTIATQDDALSDKNDAEAAGAEGSASDMNAEEDDAAQGYRRSEQLEVVALACLSLEEILSGNAFAGCSACIYLVHKQRFSKKTEHHSSVVNHRLLQGWCLRLDVTRQETSRDRKTEGEAKDSDEELLLQQYIPEAIFRLLVPHKLFTPLASIDPMCPYISQHIGGALRPLILRIRNTRRQGHAIDERNAAEGQGLANHTDGELAFDDVVVRFGARIQWGSWYAPRYTPTMVAMKLLYDRGAGLIDDVVHQCEVEKFSGLETTDSEVDGHQQMSDRLCLGAELQVWPLERRFGGQTTLRIHMQTLRSIATTPSSQLSLHHALVDGDRKELLQLGRAILALYQYVNTLDGPRLVTSEELTANGSQHVVIPWAEDIDDVGKTQQAVDDNDRREAAVRIQQIVRGWLARLNVRQQLNARRKQQRQRDDQERQRQAAVRIQSTIRRWVAAQHVRQLRETRERMHRVFEYEHDCVLNASRVKLSARFEGIEEASCASRSGETCVDRQFVSAGTFQLKLQTVDEMLGQSSTELLLPGKHIADLLTAGDDDSIHQHGDCIPLKQIVQHVAQYLTLFYSKANSVMILAIRSSI